MFLQYYKITLLHNNSVQTNKQTNSAMLKDHYTTGQANITKLNVNCTAH